MLINCGGFKINNEKLKVIDGVLTKQDSIKILNKKIAGCGGLIIDADVFKFDEKSNSLTMKESESVIKSVFAPCGGLKLDTEYFEISENGEVTLKEVIADMMKISTNNISVTKVTFESLDDFTITVKDENGNTIEPIGNKVYQLERTKPYTYEAISSNDEVSTGTITTTGRQTNVTKTIEF